MVGTKTPSAKFGPAEFSVSASEFRLFGVPLEKNWLPSYSCLERMSVSVNAKTGGMPSPKLPMDATVQPTHLRALVDFRTGNFSGVAGKARSVAEVVQQFLTYVTGVYIVGVGVRLPSGTAIETMVADRWATP